MPTSQTPPPQPFPQTAMRQQPSAAPMIQHEHNCPKCGASIDLELGRCSSCGLLYGGKQHTTQRAAPTARPPVTPSPQGPTIQQPQAAYTRPQYNDPISPVPSVAGQGPSYGPTGSMSHGGIPIPRAVPVAASTVQMPASPPIPASPYPYQAAPSAPGGEGVPAAKKRGLPGIYTMLFIIIACIFVGGGIYYFINQSETSLLPNDITDTVDITIPSIQSGPTITSITETGATIKWETDKPTTGKVDYGTTASYGSTAQPDTNLSTSHSITLNGLDPGITYHFKVSSIDAAGNEVTANGEFITLATADETPPTISGVGVSNITDSTAIITWTTNEHATSQVQYGKTETYGSETTENTNLTENHNVTLTGLSDNTTYYFKVISKDASGNEAALAAENPFTTEAIIPVGYEIGNLAPDFSLKDINGNEWTLSDFRGQTVIVNFWFILCGPCNEEMPYLQGIQASDDWPDVKILSINYEDTNQNVRSFLQDNPEYEFTVLLDPDGTINELYNVSMWPTTFFIDADGIIKAAKRGDFFESIDEIEDTLDTL